MNWGGEGEGEGGEGKKCALVYQVVASTLGLDEPQDEGGDHIVWLQKSAS